MDNCLEDPSSQTEPVEGVIHLPNAIELSQPHLLHHFLRIPNGFEVEVPTVDVNLDSDLGHSTIRAKNYSFEWVPRGTAYAIYSNTFFGFHPG